MLYLTLIYCFFPSKLSCFYLAIEIPQIVIYLSVLSLGKIVCKFDYLRSLWGGEKKPQDPNIDSVTGNKSLT